MSVPEPSTSDSNSVGSQPESSAGKKVRRPLERIIVWGLILVLGGIAGFEALTRFAHKKAFDTLDSAYRESSNRGQRLLESEEAQTMITEKIEGGMNEEQVEAVVLAELNEKYPELGNRLTIGEAEAMLSGFPLKTVEDEGNGDVTATYRWKTLLKNYGGVRLRYSSRTGEINRVTDFSPGE